MKSNNSPALPSLLVWAFVAVTTAEAFAQTKPIEIEQGRNQTAIQSGRPIPSWWDVKIHGSGLKEGRLEFRLYNDNNLLATTTTEELALSGPEQRIRVMLPPVEDSLIPIDQLRVDIRFRGKSVTQDLGKHILRMAKSRSRTFMMLVPASRLAQKQSTAREMVTKRLAFESLAPVDLEEDVTTVINTLEPSDLPQEPMGYCAYELVVLFPDEFRQMKKPFLDALAAWVRAGGSLYVEPTGVLDSHHIEFLRNLTSSDPRGLMIRPDSKGRLQPGTIWQDERIVLMSNSLGRVVIKVDEEKRDPSDEQARLQEATAFLWRIHASLVPAFATSSSIRLGSLMPHGWFPAFDGVGGIMLGAVPQFMPQGFQNIEQPSVNQSVPGGWTNLKLRTSTTELVTQLMPEGVRMVPLWVLAVILVSFVLWIGPVDYIVLGRLKARKFTWLTFPLATIFVTGLTVWITNRYMSAAETRRALIVRDVGDDGAIVRTNRFELLFLASSRPVITEIRKGVFTPLETGNEFEDEFRQQFVRQQMNSSNRYAMSRGDRHGGISQTEGRIPMEFTATQNLAKWTPQLNRVFSIPGSKDDTIIDWKSLLAEVRNLPMDNSHRTPAELSVRAQAQFGSGAMVACLGQNGSWWYDHRTEWITGSGAMNAAEMQMLNNPNFYPNGNSGANTQIPGELQYQHGLFRWIYQHSVAMPQGLFGLYTSIGPTGGPRMDDLPILDPSDPDKILLIVAVPQGDDFVVYRKLTRKSDLGTARQ